MANTSQNRLKVNQLYNELLGRDASFGAGSEFDADYWLGKSEADIRSGISGSSEFLNRKDLIDSGITDEATLDKMVTVGGYKTDMHKDYASSGDLTAFNKGNNWISNIESSAGYDPVAKDYTKEIANIQSDIGTSAAKNFATDPVYKNTNTNTNTNTTDTTTDTTNTNTNKSTGLTLADLDSWWTTKQGSTKTTDKFDQFTEFMGLLSGMGGLFGGGGVPGFASGGVAAANPYNNFMGFMNAFKSLGGGSNQQSITTGNIN
jgi:hypothetical protein